MDNGADRGRDTVRDGRRAADDGGHMAEDRGGGGLHIKKQACTIGENGRPASNKNILLCLF